MTERGDPKESETSAAAAAVTSPLPHLSRSGRAVNVYRGRTKRRRIKIDGQLFLSTAGAVVKKPSQKVGKIEKENKKV